MNVKCTWKVYECMGKYVIVSIGLILSVIYELRHTKRALSIAVM